MERWLISQQKAFTCKDPLKFEENKTQIKKIWQDISNVKSAGEEVINKSQLLSHALLFCF